VDGGPVDFPWLCEELVKGGPHSYHRNHLLVLFASRLVKQVAPDTAADAVDAVRRQARIPRSRRRWSAQASVTSRSSPGRRGGGPADANA